MAYKKRKNSGRARISNAVVAALAEGELTVATGYQTDQTLTQGTEEVFTTYGDADAKTVYPYIRIDMFIGSSTAELYGELWVIKTEGSSVPNFSDGAVREQMQREGRIFKRYMFISPRGNGYGQPFRCHLKFSNVELQDGEYLQVVLLNRGATLTDVYYYYDLEFRRVQLAD